MNFVLRTSKLSKKEQIKIHKTERNLFIFLSILLFIVLFKFFFLQPTITFQKGIIKSDNKLSYYASYDQLGNHISISLKTPDIEEAVFHEYGHYTFSRLMKKWERDNWNQYYCDDELIIQGYKEYQMCEEQFAMKFADYMGAKQWRKNNIEFFDNIYKKYIK